MVGGAFAAPTFARQIIQNDDRHERVQEGELRWQSQKLRLQFQDCSFFFRCTLLQNVIYFVSIRAILSLSSVRKFYFEYMKFDIAGIPMKQRKVVK